MNDNQQNKANPATTKSSHPKVLASF